MAPQANAEANREKLTSQWVDATFDEAYQIREEYQKFLERRKANREDLRNLAARGKLSEEQLAELEELYPARQKAEQEAEEEQAAA